MCLVLLMQCLIEDISAKEVSENILQGDVSGTSFKPYVALYWTISQFWIEIIFWVEYKRQFKIFFCCSHFLLNTLCKVCSPFVYLRNTDNFSRSFCGRAEELVCYLVLGGPSSSLPLCWGRSPWESLFSFWCSFMFLRVFHGQLFSAICCAVWDAAWAHTD